MDPPRRRLKLHLVSGAHRLPISTTLSLHLHNHPHSRIRPLPLRTPPLLPSLLRANHTSPPRLRPIPMPHSACLPRPLLRPHLPPNNTSHTRLSPVSHPSRRTASRSDKARTLHRRRPRSRNTVGTNRLLRRHHLAQLLRLSLRRRLQSATNRSTVRRPPRRPHLRSNNSRSSNGGIRGIHHLGPSHTSTLRIKGTGVELSGDICRSYRSRHAMRHVFVR